MSARIFVVDTPTNRLLRLGLSIAGGVGPDPTANPNGGPAPVTDPAAPQYGEWINQIPEPLRGQIPAEALRTINDGWLRNQDYTKKTQELADTRKLVGDRDLKKELGELDAWRTWRRDSWPSIEQRVKDYEAQGLNRAEAREQAKRDDATDRAAATLFKDITPDDFFDQGRLSRVFQTVEHQLGAMRDAAVKANREWYEKEELPRLDNVAMTLANTVLGLMKVIWPKDLPAISDLLKEASARGKIDFAEVLGELTAGRKAIEDPAEKRGYDRAVEELKAKGLLREAPPAPTGSQVPSWSPPPGAPKSDDDLLREIHGELSQKYGAPLPL